MAVKRELRHCIVMCKGVKALHCHVQGPWTLLGADGFAALGGVENGGCHAFRASGGHARLPTGSIAIRVRVRVRVKVRVRD